MKILIIEDNKDLAANLAEFLEGQGHVIDAAADGLTGLHLAIVGKYDAIVLDLMLPGVDGLEVCRRLREEAHDTTPVLMLTARDAVDDKLAGFATGADDYMIKPFSLRELNARLRALSRRREGMTAIDRLAVADLELDLGTFEARRSGKRVPLTPIGLKILELLMRESPRVVQRSKIEEVVWGDAPPDSDSLRAHVHSLRGSIDKQFTKPLLHTVRGIGYRMVDPDALST